MRRCCEETLRVLRQHKEFLLTIIEVFIHDPLYRWGLTAKGAQKRQAGGTESPQPAAELPEGLIANADAERAILKIRHKLDGLEEGLPSPSFPLAQKHSYSLLDCNPLCVK